MASNQIIIQLETEEEITIDYWKVCRINYEIERSSNGKDGYIEIWVAKCYKDGKDYVELENVDPLFFKIESGEFNQFESYNILGNTCFDFIQTVSQFLIDKNYIDGTIIIG